MYVKVRNEKVDSLPVLLSVIKVLFIFLLYVYSMNYISKSYTVTSVYRHLREIS